MPDLSFEKVQMDTTFRNCQNIYDKLSKLLDLVDVKQVGGVNLINEKLLTLSNEMYKLLCIAESVFVCDKKLKGKNVNNFTFKGTEYLDNVTSSIGLFNINTSDLNIRKTNPVVVNKYVQCNLQKGIPRDLGRRSPPTSVEKVAKSCQTSDVVKEGAITLNISDDESPQTITGKIRSEFHRNISYKDQKYLCNLCSVTITNVEDTILHINSQQHKNICKNPSLYTVKLLKDECSIDNFWSFIPAYLKICKIYIQPTGFKCTLCKCKLTCSPFAMYIHISGEAHMKNVPKSLLLEYKN